MYFNSCRLPLKIDIVFQKIFEIYHVKLTQVLNHYMIKNFSILMCNKNKRYLILKLIIKLSIDKKINLL
jgi:hypothetical protein